MAIEVIVIGTLVLWQIGILVAQFRLAWFERLSRALRLRALFPVWELFIGPQSDLSLFIRDRRTDGSWTEWREEPIWPRGVRPSILWAPCFFRTGALETILRKVSRRTALEPGGLFVEGSFPWRALWVFVLSRPRADDVVERQLRIVRTYGHAPHGEGDDVYVSSTRKFPDRETSVPLAKETAR
ncbi:MAG TPA: hypothetical protein VK116_16420 [Planctomycetota bacterium]|nr:hypothetical protein [Planctomycetota bacterium]